MKKVRVEFLAHEGLSNGEVHPQLQWLGGSWEKDSPNVAEFQISNTHDRLIEVLNKFDGFFGIVYVKKDVLVAAVDRIRSIPLFYSNERGVFRISNDAAWIESGIESPRKDQLARSEFSKTGYVTGQDTLIEQVKQIPAGSCIVIQRSEGQLKLKEFRYFNLNYREGLKLNGPELTVELGRRFDRTIERLVDFAQGRQIAIPLSGGFDSRLIASGIANCGYKHVICYTYGRSNNAEAKLSKEVAESLGFEWHFIEYTDDLWRAAWRSDMGEKFRQFSSNLSSLPHAQDFLAIQGLLERDVMKSDAVVVPGHTGDYISGGHLPSVVFNPTPCSFRDIISAIVLRHYSNAPLENAGSGVMEELRARIQRRIPIPVLHSRESLANAYEAWEWQERQAKYIVNSVRAYEFFGLNWWIPLWDTEFVDFWLRASLDIKRESAWYQSFVSNYYFDAVRGQSKFPAIRHNATDPPAIRGRLKHLAQKTFPNWAYARLTAQSRYQRIVTHPLHFGALAPRSRVRSYLRKGFNLIGIYSDQFLDDRWGRED